MAGDCTLRVTLAGLLCRANSTEWESSGIRSSGHPVVAQSLLVCDFVRGTSLGKVRFGRRSLVKTPRAGTGRAGTGHPPQLCAASQSGHLPLDCFKLKTIFRSSSVVSRRFRLSYRHKRWRLPCDLH